MIKKCKLLWVNGYWAVVDFNKTNVQVPAKWLVDDEVTLRKDGESFYWVADEDEPAVEYVGIAAEPETEENA